MTKLQTILAGVIQRAEIVKAEQTAWIRLERGLVITIEIIAGAEIRVVLARPSVPPSLVEWRIICAALPAQYKPLPGCEPGEFFEGESYKLAATWPYQERLI